MRTWKKALSLLLSLSMLLSLCVVSASAEGDNDEPALAATGVAQVGSQTFDTLAAAVEAAQNGDTIVLQNEVSEGTVTISGKTLTLDLNGKTITSGSNVISIENGAEVTLKDSATGGKVVATDASSDLSAINLKTSSELIVDGGAVSSTGYGVSVFDGSNMTVNSGSTIESAYACIAGNNKEGEMNVTVNGGTLTADQGPAIFMPSQVSLDITAGTLNGGVSLRMGQVTISGGTLIGSTKNNDSYDNSEVGYSYGGNNWLGDALFVQGGAYNSSNETYQNSLNLTISGGTFSAASGKSVALYDAGHVSQDLSVDISGGTFTNGVAAIWVKDVVSNPQEGYGVINNSAVAAISITGGTYSTAPSEFVENGYVAVGNATDGYQVKPLTDDLYVAQAETVKCLTLAEAVSTIGQGTGTITLLKDVTESVTIPSGATVTLNLNGKTLTNEAGKHTITNNGILTITGSGTVDNVSNGHAALSNTGTATLKGGTLTRSEEDSSSNTWYVVKNETSGTINLDGSTINSTSDFSSTVRNDGTMNIASGEIVTQYIGVNNYSVATLNMTGGTIDTGNEPGAFTVVNWHTANLSGGTLKGQVYTYSDSGDTGNTTISGTVSITGNVGAVPYISGIEAKHVPAVTITGGTITGTLKKQKYDKTQLVEDRYIDLASDSADAVISVFGGTFSTDPSAYVTVDKVATLDGSWFVVGEKPTVEVAAPVVVPAVSENIEDEAEAKAAQAVAKVLSGTSTGGSVETAAPTTEVAELTALANTEAQKTNVTEEAATTALNNAGLLSPSGTTPTVVVVVVPTVEIEVTGVKLEGEKVTELTVDITPVLKTVATTVTNTEDIKIKGETSTGETANAVVLDTKEVKTTPVPVTVTIPLPDEFAEVENTLYIKHASSYGTFTYEAKVQEDTNGKLFVQFTNPHGFSEFTIMSNDTESVAAIGTVRYPTLQAAVDAVKLGETITVLKSNQSATVSRDISFKVSLNSGVTSVSITAGSNTTLEQADDTYTFDYTAPSDDGGSSGNTGGSTGGNSSSSSGGGGGGSSTSATCSVTVSSATNGVVKSNMTSAAKGAKVTLTVTPASGYTLDSLTVKDASGNTISVTKASAATYTFTMPASKVTVSATFKATDEIASLPFTDVATDAYYYDAVKWAVDEGVTSGKTTTTFAPNDTCTRAQTVTFLWRAMGSPEPTSAVNPFTDVSADAYYYRAVLWAVEKGITVGTGATTFAPDATVSRAQVATFLWRAAGTPAATTASTFTDVPADAYYAAAVLWAAEKGITSGTGGTTFAPANDCTRAQIVTFLYRYLSE